jgi:hypothetical protein
VALWTSTMYVQNSTLSPMLWPCCVCRTQILYAAMRSGEPNGVELREQHRLKILRKFKASEKFDDSGGTNRV